MTRFATPILAAPILAAPILAAAALLACLQPGAAMAQPRPVSTAPSPDAAATYSLTVTVRGVRSGQGQIMAGLLKADAAAGTARNAGGVAAQARAGETTIVFSGLEPGSYAVRLFHDENGDGQMATNLFGIPTEGFAFSNNARAGFGPPDFAEMKVDVAANARTTATMSY
jgi:uncharacterized protein (DUF2141 family)